MISDIENKTLTKLRKFVEYIILNKYLLENTFSSWKGFLAFTASVTEVTEDSVTASSPGATRGLSASEAAAAAGVSLAVALAHTLTVDN